MCSGLSESELSPVLPVGEGRPETQTQRSQAKQTTSFHGNITPWGERAIGPQISISLLLVSLGDQVCRWKSHSAVGHLCLQWDYSCHFQAFKSTALPRGEYPEFLERDQEEPNVCSPGGKLLLEALFTPFPGDWRGLPQPRELALGMPGSPHPHSCASATHLSPLIFVD